VPVSDDPASSESNNAATSESSSTTVPDDQITTEKPEESTVWKKPKKLKDKILAINSKNKAEEDDEEEIPTTKFEPEVTYQSNRTGMADKSSVSDRNAVLVEANNKPKNPNQPKWAGPAKAPANLRVISRFDYQPDLCKDYKETGYCGFGDSCKFMHDRGDYKSGWQLEKEWVKVQDGKRSKLHGGASQAVDAQVDYRIKDEIEDLPWACFICREDFTNPVVTKCGHYFCEQCAIARYAKDTKCAACNQNTSGIFNTAHKMIAMQGQRKRQKETAAADQEKTKNDNVIPQGQQGWVIP
jgi:RING finger protein 113A